jgi:hypothetical protein
VVCGAHSWGATRKFKIGQTLDYGTPLESEFLGRVCQAAVGLEPEHANRVTQALLSRYESSLEQPPAGQTLPELYDLARERPRPAYRQVWDNVAAELRDLGVPLADYAAGH